MSDEKSNVSDKASEIAKNIWLAGLGAYGKAFNEAQDRLDKVSKEPPRLFKDLVEKGTELEDEVRDSLANLKRSSASSVEERIRKVRENFHLNQSVRNSDLVEINDKLDALTAKIDELSRALAPKKAAARTRQRKAPAKKKNN